MDLVWSFNGILQIYIYIYLEEETPCRHRTMSNCAGVYILNGHVWSLIKVSMESPGQSIQHVFFSNPYCGTLNSASVLDLQMISDDI